jgi:formylglycine-generating enzyme required for sulfatase activity
MQVTTAAACTLSNVTSPDSVRVMFFAVPKLLKPIPSKDITFTMGDDSLFVDTRPAHSVTITYDFNMDSTEVTQGDYQTCVGVNPSYFANDTKCPVEQVSWFEAALYCNKRSRRDGLDTVYGYTSITETSGPGGRVMIDLVNLTTDLSAIGYRLPTEAEWEFACRAGTTTDYYWGRNSPPETFNDSLAIDSNAVCGIIRQTSSPHPVATKRPNTFGLYDMSGNVWEWCNGWKESYNGNASIDPVGPLTGSWRVLRGGSWVPEWILESAARLSSTSNSYDKTFGFRVVLPSR